MSETIKKHLLSTVILTLLISYMILSRINLIFSYSLDLDGLEYMFIHYVQTILQGKPLYSNVSDFPFDTVIHMPLYPYLTAFILKLLHLTAVEDIHQQLVVLRIVSLCFLPLSIYYLLKILWLYNTEKNNSLYVVCFFMSFLTGHYYAARQDALKTSFFLMFIYYSLLFIKNKYTSKHLILLSAALIISICLKQDIVIYIGLFLLSLLLYNELKKALILTVLFLLTIILIFSVGYSIYGFKFISNTILLNLQINRSNFDSYNFYAFLFSFIRSIPVLFLLISLHLKYRNMLNNNKELKIMVFFSYLTYCVSHLLIFRAGSYINYTHEAMAITTITTGALVKESFFTKKNIGKVLFFSLLLLLSNIILHAYPINNKNEKYAKEKYFLNQKNIYEIDSIIKSSTVYFTTSDNAIFYPDKNVVYGYDYHIDRFIYAYLGFTTNTKLIGLSSVPFDNYINEGKIKYIITNGNSRDDKIIKDYFNKYTIYKKINNLIIYKKHNP